MKGEQGVRFDYENGFHLLLGTPRAEALHGAIRQAHPEMTGDAAGNGDVQEQGHRASESAHTNQE